jgi:protein-S-isoprenylcysteine O-methyltransferase Ste14
MSVVSWIMATPSISLKTILFSALIPGGLVVGAPSLLLGHNAFVLPTSWSSSHFIGAIMIAVGLAGYLSCAWAFTSIGRGTPAIWDPPRHLVSQLLYHRLRNPMYLSLVTLVTGEAVFFRSVALLAVAAVAAVCFHICVVLYEEPVLKRTFGAPYEEYCQKVNRWLPRLRLNPSRHT